MINHRQRIPRRNRLPIRRRIQEARRRHPSQLRHPLLDIFPFRIKALGLTPWILNAEIRRRIRPRPRAPLPPTIVARDFAVDQRLHEIAFAQSPIQMQVLGQKHRRDHPRAVVHVARGIQLPHGRIDNRKARPPLAPGAVFRLVLIPFHPAVFRIELMLQHLRIVPEDLEIEFPPNQLADEFPHIVASVRIAALRRRLGLVVDLANREQSMTQILRQARRPIHPHQIARRAIVEHRPLQKFPQPLPRRLLARFQPAGELLQSPPRRRG